MPNNSNFNSNARGKKNLGAKQPLKEPGQKPYAESIDDSDKEIDAANNEGADQADFQTSKIRN